MLENLFGSKTRMRLLQLFLNNPGRAFFVREISRKIGSQINSVRRELSILQKIEIIVPANAPKEADDVEVPTEKEAPQDKKYFEVNASYFLYPELKSLFVKLQLSLQEDLIKQLARLGKIDYLVLTGSFCNLPEVATDMLIVGAANKDKLARLIHKFEKEVGREINYTLMSPKEFKYRKDVTDKFLYSILENNKVVLLDWVIKQ